MEGGEDSVDVLANFKKIKDDVRHGSAMMRAGKIRKNCNYLPENSVKLRKSYYC